MDYFLTFIVCITETQGTGAYRFEGNYRSIGYYRRQASGALSKKKEY